jgi:peptidoglycan hydrolase CwlO-like protein
VGQNFTFALPLKLKKNKTMKKTIILSAAMAFATFGAFAQQANSSAAQQPHQVRAQGTVEERAKSQADKINSTVQLSADQYTKVLDLTKNFIGQKDAVRSSGAQGDDMKTKFKAIREQEEAQLKAILTADQFAKLQAARKDHEGHRPE